MLLLAAAALLWFSVPFALARAPALRAWRPELTLTLRYLWLAGIVAAVAVARMAGGPPIAAAGSVGDAYIAGLHGSYFMHISAFVLVHALFAGLIVWFGRAAVRRIAGAQFWFLALGLFLFLAPVIAMSGSGPPGALEDTFTLLRRASMTSAIGMLLIGAAMLCHAAALPVAVIAWLGNRRTR
jgi:fucose 4-O-acetylase-like acetyltransferase